MNPVFQTKFVEVDRVGNCLAACLASLLDLSLEQVPNFETFHHLPGALWRIVLDQWLAAHKYQLFENTELLNLHVRFNESALPAYMHNIPYLVWGDAGTGQLHACIYRNGTLLHDPAPDGLGFHGPMQAVFTLHYLGAGTIVDNQVLTPSPYNDNY